MAVPRIIGMRAGVSGRGRRASHYGYGPAVRATYAA